MADNKTLQKIDVFISSPGDVPDERKAIVEIIGEINAMPSVRSRYVLIPLAYENIVPPEVGDKPQKVVDKYMREVGKADLFIGVLWARMGTPVVDDDGTEYQSGTEYEFRKAYAARTSPRGKPIMLQYRCVAENPDADPEQQARVEAFFKRFEGDSADFKGLYKTYQTPSEFKGLIRKHLLEVLDQITPDTDDMKPATAFRRRIEHYRHIPLPTNYVERIDLLTELRKALIGETPDIALTSAKLQNPTALQGMGGIGKTVMARALCDDPQVQAAFPDGILWASCGQMPNVIQQLRGWIRAFNETPDDKAELDGLQAQIAKLLADRACLLIVDDVWEKKHAEAFRVGGVRCRMMITTRNERLARDFGAKVASVPLMSIDEGLTLLEEWAGEAIKHVDRTMKERIVKRVGRLALAIKLAGAQLIDEKPDRWLERFKASRLALDEADESDPHSSMVICFGLSLNKLDPDERQLYSMLSIFREDEPILEQAVEKLWAISKNVDGSSALIRKLAARALLEITQNEYPRAIVLHDLLRDLVTAELGSKAANAHESLIAAYAKTKTAAGWHTAPHDGYLYTHLAYHLHTVGRKEELYALLTDSPDWMNAKYIACVGDRAYVDDLELAISDFHDPLTAKQLVFMTQLWMARQVVNARVMLYKDTDLKILVSMGRVQEAITYARLRPDIAEKVDGLIAIVQQSSSLSTSEINLLLEAREYSREIKNRVVRATRLMDIASLLIPVKHVDEVFSLIADDELNNIIYPTDFLRKVAFILANAGRIEEMLVVVSRIASDFDCTTALKDIANNLAHASRFDEAFTVAQNIMSGYDVLSTVIMILVQSNQLDEALKKAYSINNDYYFSTSLCTVATAFAQSGRDPKDILTDALKVAYSIKNDRSRAYCLCTVATAFAKSGRNPKDILTDALTIANSIEDIEKKPYAQGNVALAYAETGHIDDAITIVRKIENKRVLMFYQRKITIVLAKNGQIDKTITIVREIEDAHSRASHLHEVAVTLAQVGQATNAYSIALSIDASINNYRNDALATITTSFAKIGHIDEALSVARAINDIGKRIAALCNIATILVQAGNSPKHVIEEALTLARSVEDKYSYIRATALRDIAVVFMHIGQDPTLLLDEILAISKTAEGKSEYSYLATRDIAIAFARIGIVNSAIDIAEEIEDARIRIYALQAITELVIEVGNLEKARMILEKIEDPLVVTMMLRIIDAVIENFGQIPSNLSEEMKRLISNYRNLDTTQDVGRDVVAVMAELGNFVKAFGEVGVHNLNIYISILSEWCKGMEKLEKGLTVKILREAVRIAEWEQPYWKKVHLILLKANREITDI